MSNENLENERELTKEEMDKITGAMGSKGVSGIACPKCNSYINVTARDLIFKQTIVCPSCGLKLNINRQSSKKVL